MFYKSIQNIYKQNKIEFDETTSCEYTTIYIVDQLKNIIKMKHEGDYTFNHLNVNDYESLIDEIMKEEMFLLEICLYKRSHTFIIFKENDQLFLVQSYLNVFNSYTKVIPNDSLYNLYKIEFLNDGILHEKLFEIEKIPCATLPINFSIIKINRFVQN